MINALAPSPERWSLSLRWPPDTFASPRCQPIHKLWLYIWVGSEVQCSSAWLF